MLFLLIFGLLVALPLYAAEQTNSSNMDQSQMYNKSQDTPHMQSQSHNKQNMQGQIFKASELIGKTVKDQKGDKLGKVDNVLISKDGRANFVVLSHDRKYYPIPFETFMSNGSNVQKVNADKDLTLASLDKDKLKSAPSFKDKKFDLSSRDWECKSFSFYGVHGSHGC